jgi:uncharacterized cupin superfamily protein
VAPAATVEVALVPVSPAFEVRLVTIARRPDGSKEEAMTSVSPDVDTRIYGAPSHANPEEWIPLDFPHKRGTTSPGRQVAGEMAFIRAEGSGTHTLLAGMWRTSPLSPGCDPKTGECIFPWEALWGDEQVYVIEGTVTVTNRATGEVHRFKPGDIFSMSKGVDTDWHVDGPYFKKYFCIAHNEPTDLDTASIPLQSF